MKGHVTIELKDVKTGKTEIIEGHNMVTNALQKFSNYNMMGFIKNAGASDNYLLKDQFLFPLATSALGAMYVLSNALPERADKIFFDDNDNVLAVCDRTIHSETNKGSLNVNESGKTETGYKSVWDFTTSQCNGQISSLALSSVSDANSNVIGCNSQTRYILTKSRNTSSSSSEGDKCIFYDKDTEWLYYVKGISGGSSSPTTDRQFTFARCKYHLDSVKISESPHFGDEEILSVETINSNEWYYGIWQFFTTSIDFDNKKIYIPLGNTLNMDSKDYLEISVAPEWSVVRKPLNTVGRRSATNGYGNVVFFHGYKYYVQDSTYKVIKMNMEDSTDVEEIMTVDSTYRIGFSITGVMLVSNTANKPAYVIHRDGSISTDPSRGNYYPVEYIGDIASLFLEGTNMFRLGITPNYIGTIFNLPSPITKTDAQMMKITYELIDA